MAPTVVIAGRPNVGKSTLFNRLAGRRAALVADTPGVTRDSKEAEAMLRGRNARLIDTAGLEEAAPETLAGRMRQGAASSVRTADLVLFVVDARAGLTPADRHFAQWLRRQNKPVLLVANKAEGRTATSSILDAYELGLGDPIGVSAEHGDGISYLMGEIAAHLPPDPSAGTETGAEAPRVHRSRRAAKHLEHIAGAPSAAPPGLPQETARDAAEDDDAAVEAARPLKLAIVGRPNAGKSTLLNRLIGEERMLVGPEPGLTRDAIASVLTDDAGRRIEIVDTAGLRRPARIAAELEKMSTGAAIGALKMAEVVILCIDAVEGLNDQDLRIAQLIEREGRACVLALNKWDAVVDRDATRRAISDRLETSLSQMKGIPVVTLSALTGAGVERLLPVVRRAHAIWNKRVTTGELNRWFENAMERHPPPLVDGRRLKLRYVTQAKARPPTFLAFGTRAERIPDDYARYLVNSLRETFDLPGTPIRLQLRGTKNPFVAEGGRR